MHAVFHVSTLPGHCVHMYNTDSKVNVDFVQLFLEKNEIYCLKSFLNKKMLHFSTTFVLFRHHEISTTKILHCVMVYIRGEVGTRETDMLLFWKV